MPPPDAYLARLAAYVEELVEPHQHTEPILDDNGHGNKRMRRAWTTIQPGLLEQLRATAHEGLRVGAAGHSGGKPSSRPPGCFEALNAHVYIAAEAGLWASAYGVPMSQRRTPEDTLRALVGVAPLMAYPSLGRLVWEVGYWRGLAAASVGWDARPYTPPVPCPMCGRFGTLRINVETRSGYCTNRDRVDGGELACGTAWPPGTGDPLYAYVRTALEGSAA